MRETYGFLVCCTALLFASCGDSEATTSGTSNSDAASDGATFGDAGPDGSYPGASKRAACRAYVEAACQRHKDCGNEQRYALCVSRTAVLCPDYFFSVGSQRTLQNVLECANEYTRFSCDKLRLGFVPDCALPGTREAGQPCSFGSQCTSASCSNDSDYVRCGTCRKLVAAGAACNPDVSCPDGQDCVSGKCTDRALSRAPRGEACNDLRRCVEGLTCSSGRCGPLFMENDSCSGNDCADGLYCSTRTSTCRPASALGQPCAFDSFSTNRDNCAAGLFCRAASDAGPAQCAARKSLSEPCAASSECRAGLMCGSTSRRCVTAAGSGESCASNACAAGLYCDTLTACRPLKTAGGSCSSVEGKECAPGLVCAAKDGARRAALLPGFQGVCTEVREEGQSCTDAGARCAEGTQCENGTCVAREGVDWFSLRCPATDAAPDSATDGRVADR
jgi:hypothetical protein